MISSAPDPDDVPLCAFKSAPFSKSLVASAWGRHPGSTPVPSMDSKVIAPYPEYLMFEEIDVPRTGPAKDSYAIIRSAPPLLRSRAMGPQTWLDQSVQNTSEETDD